MSTAAVAAEEAIGRRRERASRLTRQRVRSAWLFMAPMLIVLALVAGWPLLRTIWFSWTGGTRSGTRSVSPRSR
jgi:trehalose/maltose transport system permease protein